MEKPKTHNAKVSVALTLLLLISAFTVLSLPTNSYSQYAQAPLTQDYGDPLQYEWTSQWATTGRTYSSDGPAPEAPDIMWKRKIPGLIGGEFTAFNGKVFVTTLTNITALDWKTGKTIWSVSPPPVGTIRGLRLGEIYKISDTVMMVGGSGLSIETGEVLWTDETALPFAASGSYDPITKRFYGRSCYDISDTSKPPVKVWENDPQLFDDDGGLSGFGPYGDGMVFRGSTYGYQQGFNATTGELVWTTQTRSEMGYGCAYYEGKVIRAGTVDNTVYAFNGSTGDILWTWSPGSWYGFFTTPAVAYDKAYLMNTDGSVYAVDVNDGELVWSYEGPGMSYQGHPIVGGGKVYVTTGKADSIDRLTGEVSGISEFSCLDAETGDLIWQAPVEMRTGALGESAIIAYGNIYAQPADPSDEVWCWGTPQDWAMFRRDPEHTATGPSGPSNLNVQWKFETQGAVISSPTIADGKVFVGSQDKNLYALDARNGSLIWKFETGALIRSSPAVADGKVYTGADDGTFYCIDADDGSVIWTQSGGGYILYPTRVKPPFRSSPMVVGNRVFVGSLDNNTYALDANNGSVIWKTELPGQITASPAVANGAVYIICYYMAPGFSYYDYEHGIPTNRAGNATLYKLDAGSGDILKTYDVPLGVGLAGSAIIGRGEIWASPTVADGMIFQPAQGWQYHGINETTGEIEWTYSFGSSVFTTDSMTYHDGKVYFSERFNMHCVNATTGELIWTRYCGREIYSSSAIADGKLYFATNSRVIYVLNATDGMNIGWYEPGSDGWSSPALYEGRMYVGNMDWYVYCFADFPQKPEDYARRAGVSMNQEPTPTPEEPTPTPEEPTLQFPILEVGITVAVAVAIVVGIGVYWILRKRK